MDPKVQQQLADSLKEFVGAIKAGGNFVMDQAPLVVQEKVLYGRITETAFAVVMLAMLATCAAMAVYSVNSKKVDDDIGVPMLFFGGIGSIVSLAVIAFAVIPTLVQVWFAPRLYILEWAASLIK